MHFTEVYWTASGKRVFNVVVDGVTKIASLVRTHPVQEFA
jgi:hypothetical protein